MNRLQCIGEYVRRWQKWALSGLGDLVRSIGLPFFDVDGDSFIGRIGPVSFDPSDTFCQNPERIQSERDSVPLCRVRSLLLLTVLVAGTGLVRGGTGGGLEYMFPKSSTGNLPGSVTCPHERVHLLS